MAKGVCIVSIFYPGQFRLEQGSCYIVRVHGELASILVLRHLRPLEILDFDNEITEVQTAGKARLALRRPIGPVSEKNIDVRWTGNARFTLEYDKHLHRAFKRPPFTELVLTYEVADASQLTEQALAAHQTFLDYFVRSYRYFTHDVQVRLREDLFRDVPIPKASVVPYSDDDLSIPMPQRLIKNRKVLTGIKHMPTIEYEQTDREPVAEQTAKNLSAFMIMGRSIPSSKESLVKAFSELIINKNYNFALLTAFFAVEQFTTELLRAAKPRYFTWPA